MTQQHLVPGVSYDIRGTPEIPADGGKGTFLPEGTLLLRQGPKGHEFAVTVEAVVIGPQEENGGKMRSLWGMVSTPDGKRKVTGRVHPEVRKGYEFRIPIPKPA